METLIIIHGVSTLYMLGLIWFVQVVHYPLFPQIDPLQFETFALEHSRRTSIVVLPPMLLELGTAISLVMVQSTTLLPKFETLTGLTLLIIIWLSTFLLQVPQHVKLQQGFDKKSHRRLVNSNWIRTLAWTLRSILATLWMVRL